MVAPMQPPKSAWLDDDGGPKNQMSTFQTMAVSWIAPVSTAHGQRSQRRSSIGG